jgi:ParB family chromosome partitioning protein
MSTRKGGLNKGKGLETLIPQRMPATERRNSGKSGDPEVKIVEKVVEKIVEKPADTYLKISEVVPNAEQPRKDFDEDALTELSESIRQFGILQPLLVRKKGRYYEIIAGERRWRAAKMAGLKKVPVIIREYSPQEIVEISLIENIQRENLNAIEEAQAYRRLIEEFHLKQDEIAERVSKSRAAVTNSMRLLKLDERVQKMLVDEMLTTGHARAILGLESGEMQYMAAQKVFDEKLSVRETEKLVKLLLHPKLPAAKERDSQADAVYRQLEEKLKGIVGTKVSIQRGRGEKGKIEIEYYSREELERIIELIETAR